MATKSITGNAIEQIRGQLSDPKKAPICGASIHFNPGDLVVMNLEIIMTPELFAALADSGLVDGGK